MSFIDDMAGEIALDHKISRALAESIVRSVFVGIEEAILRDGECQIPKFGKFAVTERAGMEGRNVRTGEPVKIPAYKGARFRPSAALKARLNEVPRAIERAGPPTPRRAVA